MKRRKLLTGISTAAVALALCMGITGTAQAAKTNDASVVQTEVTQVGAPPAPAISLKQTSATGQTTTSWTVNYPMIPEGYRLWFNAYNPDTPLESEIGSWYKDKYGRDIYEPEYDLGFNQFRTDYTITFDFTDFTPGKKYIVAYYYAEAEYEAACEAALKAWNATPHDLNAEYINPSMADYISPASAPIEIEVGMEANVSTIVKSTSIQLDMSAYKATGYEVYRKVGKKFKKVATVASSTYVDKGLLSKTEYSYKVRPYYKDPDSGKIYYGKYTQLESTTKGSALKLKLTVKNKKNVKLSWKKVPGAVRYEVYRYAGSSGATTVSKDVSDWYEQWKLIKTLGKSKKSYVDKKTVANESYSYIVRAVLAADKKVKGDKTTYVEESARVSFTFDAPQETARYEDAAGNITVEWEKAYGIDGYAIFKRNTTTGVYDDTGIRLGKNVTKYKFIAESVPNQDGTWNNYAAAYRLRSLKGTQLSDDYISVEPEKQLGLVASVTAKKVDNGVQVSWTPVAGAAYYEVYRVKAGSLTKNKDIGGYYNLGGTQVTEYVGAQAPVAVDVATYNAGIDAAVAADKAAWTAYDDALDKYYDSDAYQAYLNSEAYNTWLNKWLDEEATYAERPAEPGRPVEPVTSGLYESDKLDVNNGPYYYQNYVYAHSQFTATSIVDYYGDIYSSYTSTSYADDGVTLKRAYTYPTANAVESRRPVEGTNYQYYVIAYMAMPYTIADYADYTDPAAALTRAQSVIGVTPGTTSAAIVGSEPEWHDPLQQTMGCGKIGQATYTTVKAPKKATIKSLKASKGTVTVSIKKKVKGATAYKVYRSTKKKGKYMCVGTTKKKSFKDTGLEKGKTYYYKVVAVSTAESGADIEGKASAAKSVKVK